jgi:hypothetical protein
VRNVFTSLPREPADDVELAESEVELAESEDALELFEDVALEVDDVEGDELAEPDEDEAARFDVKSETNVWRSI